MKHRRSTYFSLLLALILLWPGRAASTQSAAHAPDTSSDSSTTSNSHTSRVGWLTIRWGDGPPGLNLRLEPIYILADETGRSTRLLINENLEQFESRILALNGQRVRVWGQWERNEGATGALDRVEVAAIQLEADSPLPTANAVVGSYPWVSLLCKFSDINTEPNPLSYFQQMYGDAYPGLDHYWREQSYNLINVVNSQASGWYTLPHPRDYYIPPSSSYANLSRLAEDCTAAAEPWVDFTAYVGINFMFNDNLDCCAWGGAWYSTLDGVSQVWRTTWNPPWAFQNLAVISHEMGHGFGLPHSGGAGLEYNDPWDVMGDIWSFCALATHPVYGCLAPHTIAYHKDRLLGWIPPEQKYLADWNTSTTLTLEQMALPQTGNYKFAQTLSCTQWQFYTVEVRRQVGYDVKAPGNAVVIHKVYTGRSFPAEVVDADGNGNTGDAGAMWTAGETFSDPEAGVTITVDSATPTGFVVSITNVPPVACQPDAPYLMLPAYGSSWNTRTINFTWQPPYAPHQAGYEFRLSTSPDPDTSPWLVNTLLDVGTTAYTYTLPADGDYYWFMRTQNTFGQSSMWASNPFSVDTVTPTLGFISPTENGYLTANQVAVEVLAEDEGTGVTFVQLSVGYDDGNAWGWHTNYEDDWPADGWGFVWDAATVPDQTGVAFEALARDPAGNLAVAQLWNVTLDRTPPSSAVAALPSESSTPLWVTWSGSDSASGIVSYTVQYKDEDSGNWINWQDGVTNTSALFNGLVGHTYYFRSRASDQAGHLENWPPTADTYTTITGLSTETPTPTVTATRTATPSPTPTATTMPSDVSRYIYLPVIRR